MYFTKSLLLLSCALSAYAVATPHMARDLHHHAVIARNVAAPATADPVAPSVVARKRSINRRCKATASSALASSSSSSSAVASSSAAPSSSAVVASTSVKVSSSSAAASTSAAPVNVGGDVPTFASSSAAPTTSAKATTSSKAPAETSSTKAPVKTSSTEAKASSTEAPVVPSTTEAPTTTSKVATKTSTSEAPATTTPASSSSDTGSFIDGTHTGDATFYATGLGACGITNSDTDFIAAASEQLFDIFPGYDGANPNDNPICNKKVTANYQGKTVSVTITDRCTGCSEWSLDFSPAAFNTMADPAIGRLHGMTWSFD